MAEYIDRWAVAIAMCKSCSIACSVKADPCALLDVVLKAPAAEVVEVVRCKDCVYGTLYTNMAGAEYVDCALDDCSVRKPHDFCSYGERRNDNVDM